MTSAIHFRSITRAEVGAWSDAMTVGFLDVPDPARYPFIEEVFDDQRCIAAMDGTKIVGTYASFTTNITVPGGGEVLANAVTGVTVLPTHRGREILRTAITDDLTGAKDRGEPVAILFASEFGIYARFGFGVATESIRVEIDTTGIAFRSRKSEPGIRTVELVDAGDAIALCEPVFAAMRRTKSATIERNMPMWRRSFGLSKVPEKWVWKGHVAVTKDERGRIDGYVRYKGADDWSTSRPQATLTVNEFVAVNFAAEHRLLHYLCTMAWVSKVVIEECPPDDESHLHLIDERRVRRLQREDQLWSRILDVPELLTTRTYEGTDRLTLDVIDSLGFTSGRYTLDASPEGVTCKRSRSKADLTVSVNELSSIAFGGASLGAFVRGGRADEHTRGAARRVDRLFQAARAPWNPTHF
jgi:predicted acetyltransferase